jgi:hypothetical protein
LEKAKQPDAAECVEVVVGAASNEQAAQVLKERRARMDADPRFAAWLAGAKA